MTQGMLRKETLIRIPISEDALSNELKKVIKRINKNLYYNTKFINSLEN